MCILRSGQYQFFGFVTLIQQLLKLGKFCQHAFTLIVTTSATFFEDLVGVGGYHQFLVCFHDQGRHPGILRSCAGTWRGSGWIPAGD